MADLLWIYWLAPSISSGTKYTAYGLMTSPSKMLAQLGIACTRGLPVYAGWHSHLPLCFVRCDPPTIIPYMKGGSRVSSSTHLHINLHLRFPFLDVLSSSFSYAPFAYSKFQVFLRLRWTTRQLKCLPTQDWLKILANTSQTPAGDRLSPSSLT